MYEKFISSSTRQQPTLQKMPARREIMSTDNAMTVEITALTQDAVLYDQPLSLNDNEGAIHTQ